MRPNVVRDEFNIGVLVQPPLCDNVPSIEFGSNETYSDVVNSGKMYY